MINLKKKIIAVVTTMTVAAWMIPGSAFALTAAELQIQINALMAQLATLQSQLATVEAPATTGGAVTGVPADFTFTANLKQGDSSAAVKNLQIVFIDKENNLMLVKGAIAGRRGTLVEVINR